METTLKIVCDPDSVTPSKSYSDVFHASDWALTNFSKPYDLPVFNQSRTIPDKLIPFDKAICASESLDFDCFVHFFIQDVAFERFWTNTDKYILLLKRFKGCISPDFSLYYNMPYPHQLFNCYRNRLLGSILARAGVEVILNVSFGDPRSYDFCTSGIPNGSVIATGSLGTMKNCDDRAVFTDGLFHVLSTVESTDLLIYGSVNDDVISLCNHFGTRLHVFRPVWDGTFISRRSSYGKR